jgi:hypothetical protein
MDDERVNDGLEVLRDGPNEMITLNALRVFQMAKTPP